MATITVRDVPEEVAAGIDLLATAAGMSRETWVRALFHRTVSGPFVRAFYSIRFATMTSEQNTMGMIVRDAKGSVQGSFIVAPGNPREVGAYNEALALVERNRPGDREQALVLLGKAFREVYETPQ